ncbi:hypothetical protein BASA82_000265 [Batrachochytrium salamandrivorans]|nr:hypothetical protein BASA81_002510 [Batrachochytrium salamandrivorans]KAH9262695.1 hypothetical protein BASA82_000265 [Batrachochytrium salamandrivorans]
MHRQVELALQQKQQADELVGILTKRCDELRVQLAAERKERETVFQKELLNLDEAFELETSRKELVWEDERRRLELRLASERSEKARLGNKLRAALDKVVALELELGELEKRNEEYRLVAQSAVTEASEVVRLLGHLSIKRT